MQNKDIDERENNFVLRAAPLLTDTSAAPTLPFSVTKEQLALLIQLQQLPRFSGIFEHMQRNEADWHQFLTVNDAESVVPKLFSSTDGMLCCVERTVSITCTDAVNTAFGNLLLVKALRPDRVIAASSAFVSQVFGPDFEELPELDWQYIIEHDSKSYAPLLICSAPGHDPSYQIDALAQSKPRYVSLPLGSEEGFKQADKAVSDAMKTGFWV